jgi:hypothetical protein
MYVVRTNSTICRRRHDSKKYFVILKLITGTILQKAKDDPKTATVDLMSAFCKETAAPALRGRAGAVKAMERKIQRYKTRALDHPKRPATFDDLVSLPEKFLKTAAGDKFLIFNKMVGTGSGMEVDSTQEAATQGTSTSGKSGRGLVCGRNFLSLPGPLLPTVYHPGPLGWVRLPIRVCLPPWQEALHVQGMLAI